MRGLRIASVDLRRKKIVKNSSNKHYNGPPKIDVVGKKHNNSLNHASKTKQKQSHTDTVSRLTKEDEK